jgi:hypothetical protein
MHNLYVIGEEGSSFVKIGKAHDVDERLKLLQIGNPRRLIALHVEHKAGRYEHQVHQRLSDYHLRGEWFDLGQDPVAVVLEAITAIQDGWKKFYLPKPRPVNKLTVPTTPVGIDASASPKYKRPLVRRNQGISLRTSSPAPRSPSYQP